MIVVDASVVVDLLLGSGGTAGDRLAGRLRDRESVLAPHLLDVEVGQVLRRYVQRGELEAESAAVRLRRLVGLPVRRVPHGRLLPRAFELRANVPMYDGVYLALAEAVDAPLVTGDAGLEDVPGARARVEFWSTG